MKTTIISFVLCLVIIGCSDQKRGYQYDKEIDQLLNDMVKPGGPGAIVAVGKGSDILFSKGYGEANVEYNIPNGPSTVFHVASVSKQFTAFAIAMLADQGKLSLDDDIRKHIPELPDFKHKITLRHLAHHTSGLRDQWNLLALAGWRLDDVITRDQVLRIMQNQRELNFKPGDEFSYCNTGYTLLAEVVSRVTKKDFPDWCKENIFDPLEMNNTLFYTDHEKIVENRAYSYHDSPEGLKKSVLSYANAGATSLFTTAEDLIKWTDNFATMKVGNERVMRQMEEKAVLNKGDTIGYAFGLGIDKYKGVKIVSHDGADAGYRSTLVRFPEHNLSIAVLSNMASFNPGKVAFGIADLYLADVLQKDTARRNVKTVAAVTIDEKILKQYEGKYAIDNAMIFEFKSRDGKLTISPSGQEAMELATRSDSVFALDEYGVVITFNRSEKGWYDQFTLEQGGQRVIAPRFKPFDASGLNLTDYTGVYFSPELETSYKIELKGDSLVANHIRHNPVRLTAIEKDAFSTGAWYMGRIDFVRDARSKINGLKVSSGRVKNVLFEKQ